MRSPDLRGFLRGLAAIYSLTVCSIVLLASYVVLVLPVFPIKRIERRMQEVMQFLWVYLLLGITANAADSKLVIYLPEDEAGKDTDGGNKQSDKWASAAKVYRMLRSAQLGFDPETTDMLSGSESGKDIPPDNCRREIIICNHQIYMDWIYIWALMSRLGRSGVVKIILKRSLLNIPIFGWGMKVLNFIFLHRKWEVDRVKFGRRLRRLLPGGMPFSLIVFPEGTVLCENGERTSCEYGQRNQLPIPKHSLIPRVTGMQFALNTIGPEIDGMVDMTVAYSGTSTAEYPEVTFGLNSLFFHGVAPPVIHLHLRYFSIDQIPFKDPDAFKQWLYRVFQDKDALLAEFYRTGRFPCMARSKPIELAPASSMPWIVLATLFCTILLALAAQWAIVRLMF